MNLTEKMRYGKKILSGLFVSLLIPLSGLSATEKDHVNILVDAFTYRGEQHNSWVSAGISDTIVSDFSRFKGINIFSADDRRRAIEEIELGMSGIIREKDITRMGGIMGASLIISGSVQVSNRDVRMISKIINVRKGGVEKTVKISGTLDRLFQFQDEIVAELLENIRTLHPRMKVVPLIRREEIQKITGKYRPGVHAFEWYSRGLEVHYTNPAQALKFYLKASGADADYFDPLFRTGWVYQNLGRYGEALKSYSRALAILEKQKLLNTGKHSYLLNNMAIVYKSTGRYREAIENYSRSMEIRKRNRRHRTSAYAVILGNTGLVYSTMGKYDKAGEFYLRAHRLYTSLNLMNTVPYATLLNNRGFLSDTRGRYKDALKYYSTAKKIYRAHSLENTNTYARILSNISMVYQRERKYGEALTTMETARKIQEKLGLTGTGDYAITINNIGIIHYRKGEFDASLGYFTRAGEIHLKLNSGNSAEYARVVNNIGVVYNKKKDYKKAVASYLKSKEIRDRLGLDKTGSYAILMFNIGLIYYEKLGKPCEAARYLKTCVAIRKKMGHSQYPENLKLLEKMRKRCGDKQ